MSAAREQIQVQPITERYLLDLDEDHVEVVDGEIVIMPPPGMKHGWIGANVIFLLLSHVKGKGLGRVFDDMAYVLEGEPGNVRLMRAPDVSFVAQKNLPPEKDIPGFLYQPPDLAVEVVSPSERSGETMRKINDYLRAGTGTIWVIYPETRQVVVHTPAGATILNEDQTLDGGALLPGLAIPVAAIFE